MKHLRHPVLIDKNYDIDGNVKNTFHGREYLRLLREGADEISNYLASYCGPYASYVAIPSRMTGGQLGEVLDTFTKDGITILRHMRTDQHIMAQVMRLASVIGQSVDSRCHDGTTTSMLFFTSLVSHLSHAKLNRPDHKTSLHPHHVSLINIILNQLESIISENTLLPEYFHNALSSIHPNVTMEEIKYSIAYHQAYISSKGDKEVAEGVAKVLSKMPTELYGYYVLMNSPIERPERFIVEQQPFDIEFNSNLFITSMRNHALDTQVYLEDADMLISAIPLINDTIQSETLRAHLDPSSELRTLMGMEKDEVFFEKPTILVCPEINIKLTLLIEAHNKTYPHAKIYPFSLQCPIILRGVFGRCISSMAGVSCMDDLHLKNLAPALIRNIKVHHVGYKLKIFNLYQKTGEISHPFYSNPDANADYTKCITELKSIIEDVTIRHSTSVAKEEVDAMIMLYRAMTCQEIVDLRIAGTTHELLSNRSVVEDAMGSAISAISDGVVLGGYPRLLQYLSDKETIKKTLHIEDPFIDDILDAFVYALADVCHAIYQTEKTTKYETPFNHIDFGSPFQPSEFVIPNLYTDKEDILKYDIRDKADEFLLYKNLDHPILLQPVAGYKEQFKRLKDILPKIFNTSTMINTSYVAKEER